MYKLVLRPESDGYTSADGTEVIATALDGGASRFRRDKIGTTKTVNVKWTLNPTQYQYWRAFFVTGTKNGSLPFLCDLLSEDGNGPVEHVCNFVPGTVTLPTQIGFTYVQQAVLEVIPIPHDEAFDVALLGLYDAVGLGDVTLVLDQLERLVNTDFPEAVGG
jgi:hypothetical protein